MRAKRVIHLLTALLTLCFLFSTTQAAIEPTSGRYTEIVTDMAVQVPGGTLAWQRTWRDGEWQLNRRWVDLRIEYDADDSNIRRIFRNNDVYERLDSGGTRFGFGPRMRIRVTENGLRWNNREGAWIEYDEEGRILRIGGRNQFELVLLRDGEGRIGEVRDGQENTIYTVAYDSEGNIEKVTDRTEREVIYQYTDGRLTTVTDVRGYDWEYGYSGDRLTSMMDPRGHTTTISYTADGRVHRLKRPGTDETTYEFDYLSSQRQYYLRTTRPGGEVVEAWYHRDGDLIRRDINGQTVLRVERDGRKRIHFDFNGHRTIYDYDEFRNPTGITWPDGETRVTEYEHQFFQITREVDEAGVVTRHQYDNDGNRTRTIEAEGTALERVTEYDYDNFGQVTEIRRLGDDNTETAVTKFEYDEHGSVTKITAPEGGVQTFSHDIMGNVLTRIDAREQVWTFEYDAAGNLTLERNPLEHETRHEYDEVGNRTKVIHADQTETVFEYDEANRLVKQIDALGGEQVHEYDAAGNRVKEIDPSGKTIEYEYDSSRRQTKIVDGVGDETIFHYPDAPGHQIGKRHQPVRILNPTFERHLRYDRRGREIARTDRWQEGTEVIEQIARTFYDGRGNTILTRDPAGRETEYVYDALGRVTSTTDALSYVTQYRYDNRDNLISLTDANNNTHAFTYDRANRMLTEARPLGQMIEYVYNAAGQRARRTDPVGHRAEYIYDDAGRRTQVRHYHADDPDTPDKVVSFEYDEQNRLTGYDDGYTNGSYQYDELGRKTEETVNFPGFSHTHQQSWHANGRQQSLTAPDGVTYSFAWDAADRMQAIFVPGEGTIQYTDYRWHQPRTITFPGGSTRTQNFDGLGRHKRIKVEGPAGQLLMDYAYTWDETGNIAEKATEHGQYSYGYDDINRLIEASYPTFSAEEWTYDSLGNRLTDSRTGEQDWEYNENNELLDSVEYTHEYDDNGSLIAEYHPGGNLYRTFEYNSENRISAVINEYGKLIAEYRYDPFGRRIQKMVYDPPGSNPETTWYIYSDQGLMAELDGTGNQTDFYLFPPDGLWGTDPIMRKAGSSYYYYQTDHLGTPQQLIDQVGNIVHSREMRAFGEMMQTGIEDRLRFPGQFISSETGLYYNYWRDYSVWHGRYAQRDPAWEPHVPFSIYGYVDVNPVLHLDPYGLFYTKLDWELMSHYLSGRGGIVAISPKYCPLYLGSKPMKRFMDYVENEITLETKRRAPSMGEGEVDHFTIRRNWLNYIRRIYSFGDGNDNVRANCEILGECIDCATSTCDLLIYRHDEFKDPIDLHQGWGVGDSPWDKSANPGGKPFRFVIYCQQSFQVRACG